MHFFYLYTANTAEKNICLFKSIEQEELNPKLQKNQKIAIVLDFWSVVDFADVVDLFDIVKLSTTITP